MKTIPCAAFLTVFTAIAGSHSMRAEEPAPPRTVIAIFAPPSVTRDGYETVPGDEIEANSLIHQRVYDADENWIGVARQLVQNASGTAIGIIVDFGGFLGMGESSVAIRLDSLTVLRNVQENKTRIYLSVSDKVLDTLPTYRR